MFKKTKTFAQITAAFSKPIAELEACVQEKRDAANAAHQRAIDHDRQAFAARNDSSALHNEADEAAKFKSKLEAFLS